MSANKGLDGWSVLRGLMIGIGLTCAGLDAIMHMWGWCAFMLASVIVQLGLFAVNPRK